MTENTYITDLRSKMNQGSYEKESNTTKNRFHLWQIKNVSLAV